MPEGVGTDVAIGWLVFSGVVRLVPILGLSLRMEAPRASIELRKRFAVASCKGLLSGSESERNVGKVACKGAKVGHVGVLEAGAGEPGDPGGTAVVYSGVRAPGAVLSAALTSVTTMRKYRASSPSSSACM
jgi:hypothetical protein